MAWAWHARLQFGGGLLAGAEQWTCSISFTTPNVTIGSLEAYFGTFDPEAWIDDLAADVLAFVNDTSMGWQSTPDLRFVKFNVIDPNGHYRDDVTHEKLYDPPHGFGGNEMFHPLEDTICVSLRTGLRGPRHRGRLYLPPQGYNLDNTTGMLSSSSQNAYLAGVHTFFNNLNNWPGIDPAGAPATCVASSFGENTLITSVAVGSVPDTQRRRRRSLVETYVTATVT
jgi:hypothetical protein